jgi:PAS domain S-box-containing protein
MNDRRWLWATLTLSSISIVSAVFAVTELVEFRFFRDAGHPTPPYFYVIQGIAASLLLAFWAAWFVLRERRKAEEELRRSSERYRGLLGAFPGAVVLFDSDLRVLEWNASAERMYGYTAAEIAGRPLPIVPPEKTGELMEFVERVKLGGSVFDVESLRQPKNGDAFDVQLSLLPFREAPGPLCFLEVASDIRERVRLRAHMFEIEKLTSMGKMAAGTAHHLNSPLAALLMRVQLMRRSAESEALDGDLARIEDGLNFCRHFVQRLLEFTRSRPIEKHEQDLGLVVESVAAFFRPAALAKRASLVVNASEGKGRLVRADRNLLEALLLSLLGNALDAVEPGGEIRLECRSQTRETAGFAVIDNGCGIRPADLERVFEPFFTTKEPGKGTGLGLAIARNIVVEHGGTIAIDSRPGAGSTVLVEFPVAAIRPCETAGAAPLPSRSAAP